MIQCDRCHGLVKDSDAFNLALTQNVLNCGYFGGDIRKEICQPCALHI